MRPVGATPPGVAPPPPGELATRSASAARAAPLARFLQLCVVSSHDEVVSHGELATVASDLRQECLAQARREQADAAGKAEAAARSAARAHFVGKIVGFVLAAAAIVGAAFTFGASLALIGAATAAYAVGACGVAAGLAKLAGVTVDHAASQDALDGESASLQVASTDHDADAAETVVHDEGEALAASLEARRRALQSASQLLDAHAAALGRTHSDILAG